ncbi:MAG: efflux RND transporter periplasmic adaptor subunit [Chromatiaceae bacterium]|nr:efflux RND transporter periplasmic adaptor subunit [Chromatiaceae bacterium]
MRPQAHAEYQDDIAEAVNDLPRNDQPTTPAELTELLGVNAPHKRRHVLRWALVTLAAMGLAAFLLWPAGNGAGKVQYATEAARVGDLVITVSATGHLQPTNQVDVGSELSGIVDSVAVDYNARVKAGEVLAQLDTDKLRAQVLQSEASLASAEAKVNEAQATVLETQLKLQRCLRLAAKQLCTDDEADTNRAANQRARAAEGSAKAQVAEARAKLEVDRTNLDKASIRSPIDGVVLVRAVEPGQTVAASLQAPVLFKLAEDLAQMELHVDVDEADVGQVAQGQDATFTVDAFPDRRFEAQITQVRFGAQEVDGVITYETLLKVDNADLLLRPGMTATAEIVVKRVDKALLVPNAALRFNPEARANRPAARQGSLLGQLMPRPPRSEKPRSSETGGRDQQRVWTLRDGAPLAIPVQIGTSDGLWTEVTGGELKPGTALLVDVVKPQRAS